MTLLQPDLMARLAATFPDAVAWRNLADGAQLTLGDWHRPLQSIWPGACRLRGSTAANGSACSSATRSLWNGWCRMSPSTRRARWRCRCWPGWARSSWPRILEDAGASVALCSEVVPEVQAAVRTVVSTASRGDLRWADLLSPRTIRDLAPGYGPDDVADIMYTSGTTGRPKGVVVRHGGLSTTERVPSSWLGLGFLTSSPFATTSGSLLVTGPLRGGLSGWFLPRFSAEAWVTAVERDRPDLGLPRAGHGRAHCGLAPVRDGRPVESGGRHRRERADCRGDPATIRCRPAQDGGPLRLRNDRVRCRHRHADG